MIRLQTSRMCFVDTAPRKMMHHVLQRDEALPNLCNIQEENHDNLGIAQYSETLTIFNPERFCALRKGIDGRNEPMCNVAVLGDNDT
jgi:hypothetical protein